MISKPIITAILLITQLSTIAQKNGVFIKPPLDSIGIITYELFPTIEGAIILSSSVGLWSIRGREMTGSQITSGVIRDEKGRPIFQNIKPRNYTSEDSIRSIAQGKDSMLFFVTHDNRFMYRPNGLIGGFGWAPFNFPKTSVVTRIWIDNDNNLFAGTKSDNFYLIKKAAQMQSFQGTAFDGDKDSNVIVTQGALPVEQIIISPGTAVYSFAQDAVDNNMVWVGTNKGLYSFDKNSGNTLPAVAGTMNYSVTDINTMETEKIWFSTLEKGMGVLDVNKKSIQFYSWAKSQGDTTSKFPIKTFCYKSREQFFVAIMDSTPAVFSTKNGSYLFITDSVLNLSANRTTDINVDKLGNLLLIKGGSLYISDVSKSDLLKTAVIKDSSLLAPFILSIKHPSGEEIASQNSIREASNKISLRHDQNSILVYFNVNDFADKKDIHYAWNMLGYSNGWMDLNLSNIGEFNFVPLEDLRPGKYILQVRVKLGDDDWRKQMAELEIIVIPPFWQTWWFWLSILATVGPGMYFLFKWRINEVRKFEREKINREREKISHEKELLELEAMSLRAQMNPHFIYNCLNSIKALIQTDEKIMASDYLTTFSKLIRTVFQNSDKRQISLYDEIETCKLYTRLEAMRLNGKLKYSFNVDPEIDLKSVMVPALIIQPFIENAIWHGIVPKETGGSVNVSIKGNNEAIVCTVEDDGIGRKRSKLSKPETTVLHESKGVHLSQARLNIEKALNDKSASIDTIDLYEDDQAVGTRVILTFNLQ